MPIKYIDPADKTELELYDDKLGGAETKNYQRINGAYRISADAGYTENFGYQWNKFIKTQIDTQNMDISKIRFFAETNWDKEDLSGKNVLEVGSGAGRFSEVILNNTKANLFSVDYSNAVEANYANNGHHGNRLKLFQASIYEMPFAPQQFDKVVCVGVLQHTPDFKRSINSLAEQVKRGGELVVDFYPINGWWTKLCAKYMLRPFTKKMNHDKLLKLIERNINWMINLYFFLHRIKLGVLCRFIPICDIKGCFPYQNLTRQQLKEWCVLDTFDMFSPEHDHPQTVKTVEKWVKASGLQVTFAGYVTFGNEGYKAAVVKGIRSSI
ncbi:MAG: class I SAM-dependent methyltransferase [Bacteroidetes bacterium]|nr:class I SAM-dependent methyltransferase [Bacteroidota bacterium]